MSHEPECVCGCGDICYCYECSCDILRAAYQRGRKDAADDVAAMPAFMLVTVGDLQKGYVSKAEAYHEAFGITELA